MPLTLRAGIAGTARFGLVAHYELIRADGEELPAELWRDPGAVAFLHADHIHVDPDGTVLRESVFRIEDEVTGESEEIRLEIEAEYRLDGRRIEIGWFDPCPPNALCIPNDHGRVRNARLELETAFFRPGLPVAAEYQRR